jgi:hypothetical protein
MSQNPIESLAAGAENLSENICVCLEDGEEQIRQQPLTSVLIAVAVGLLLSFLPVGRIFAPIFRSLLALVKPVLLVLGVLKVFCFLSGCKSAQK